MKGTPPRSRKRRLRLPPSARSAGVANPSKPGAWSRSVAIGGMRSRSLTGTPHFGRPSTGRSACATPEAISWLSTTRFSGRAGSRLDCVKWNRSNRQIEEISGACIVVRSRAPLITNQEVRLQDPLFSWGFVASGLQCGAVSVPMFRASPIATVNCGPSHQVGPIRRSVVPYDRFCLHS